MTSYKEKNQLVDKYVEENKQRFHDYENLGFDNLTVFKATLVDFLHHIQITSLTAVLNGWVLKVKIGNSLDKS